MLEHQGTAGDGEEGAVDVPQDGAHLRQARQMWSGLGPLHLGRGRPGQLARVEVSGVLFQRQGHGFNPSLTGTPAEIPLKVPGATHAGNRCTKDVEKDGERGRVSAPSLLPRGADATPLA